MVPQRRFDLHTHTDASDGTLSPTELVSRAYAEGLSSIAITDHDTMEGVREAQETGRRLGIEVIPGVEMSAEFEPEVMHVLAYFADDENPALSSVISRAQTSRRERNPEITRRLQSLGVPIQLDEVVEFAGEGQVGRPHFAQVLIQKGVVASVQEAFERFLNPGAPAYFERVKPSPAEIVAAITEAGGVSVLAHPHQLHLGTGEKLESLIRTLLPHGLGGIEAYYPLYTRETTQRYLDIAGQYGLIATGGSDFHGESKPTLRLGVAGEVPLPVTALDDLKALRSTRANS